MRGGALRKHHANINVATRNSVVTTLKLHCNARRTARFTRGMRGVLTLTTCHSSIRVTGRHNTFSVCSTGHRRGGPFVGHLHRTSPRLCSSVIGCNHHGVTYLAVTPAKAADLVARAASNVRPIFLPICHHHHGIGPGSTRTHISFISRANSTFRRCVMFRRGFMA